MSFRDQASSGIPPTLFRQGLVVAAGPSSYDSLQAMNPSVLVENGTYRMWYGGCDPSYGCSIILATSSDGRHWTKEGVVLSPIGGNESIIGYPSVVKVGGTYWMYYSATGGPFQIFAATSPDGTSWTRRGLVLSNGSSGSPDAAGAFAPRILFEGGTYRMWYTGIPASGASDIVLAESTDGLSWTKRGLAVAPGPAGSLDSYAVQYASVVHLGSTYIMAYTGLTSPTTASILYANSTDGVAWTKDGQLLAGIPGIETNVFQPDVVILPTGQWDLYYAVRNGAGDLAIYLAQSDVLPPVTTATVTGTPGQDGWFVSSVTVALNGTDDASGVASTRYSLDQGPWTAFTGPLAITGDGTHTLRYNSTDNAGVAEATKDLEIRIDATAPAATLAAPSRPTQSSVIVSWTASDSGSGVSSIELSVDAGSLDNVTGSTSQVLVLGAGTHTIVLRVTDHAGNSVTKTATVTVDTNAFSFTGPYLGIPLIVLTVAIALAPPLAYWVVERRRRRRAS